MVLKEIEFVEVPERLVPALGEKVPGTRMYRRFGTQEDFQGWWDAVGQICGDGGAGSPGGVSMYARVTRAGVHKRMREGRITAFVFYLKKGVSRWRKREILEYDGSPYCIYIPGSEMRSWAEVLGHMDRKAQAREAVGDGDLEARFLKVRGRKVERGETK